MVFALGDLVFWAVVALAVLGAAAFVFILGRIGGAIPLVGGYVAGALEWAFNSLIGVAGWVGGAAMWPVSYVLHTLGKLWQDITGNLNWAIGGVGAAVGALSGWAHQAVYDIEAVTENAIAGVTNLAWSLYWDAVHYTQQLYNQAVGVADNLYNAAVGTAENLYNAAVGYATSVYSSATGYAAGLFNQAEADITNAYNAAVGAADSAVNALAGEAAHAIDVLNSNVDALAGSVPAIAATQATGAVSAHQTGLDQAVADAVSGPYQALLSGAGSIAGALPADLVQALGLQGVLSAAAPATIVGAITALYPLVGAVTADVADCVTPYCDQLKGLGSGLKGLESLGMLALVAALLAAAVDDPTGAAQAVVDATGWMTTVGVDLADAVGATVA